MTAMDTTLLGRYRLEDRLYSGSSADLYWAYDAETARYVALKVFHPHIAAGQGFAERLRALADRLATLSHPHIVQLYAGEVANDPPFLVMEYVDGGTLRDRLADYRGRDEWMPADEVTRLVSMVASALDYAHDQGVIHGTLTPARVLCTRLNEPVLTGFAVAPLLLHEDGVFAGGGAIGTPAYTSPEQAAGRSGDAHSDLYTLGLLLYEMVAGCVPFTGDAATILADHQHTAPPPPRQLRPDLPLAVQDVVLRALAKRPADRFPRARDLALALKAAWRSPISPPAQAPLDSPTEESSTPVLHSPASGQQGMPARHEPVAERIGRYQIDRELGRGGMAVVYLAHDPYVGREVAIKVVAREAALVPGFQERFQHEARLIANLEHPCIVRVYDYGICDGEPFMVMHYLAGGSLATRLARGPLTAREMAPIVERVAAGLDAAHAAGIVHRDLKPGNILFDLEQNAYLSDFGISIRRHRRAEAPTTDRAAGEVEFGGTPRYMSPEQVRALVEKAPPELDGRSDIYSLGLVLFEALTGRIAFQGPTAYETAIARLTEPVPQIRAARASVPAAMQEIMNRVLARDPADRYSTGSELARDFRELAAGRWFLRRLAD